MRKAEGGVGVSQLECVNPRKDKWRLRWGVLPKEDSENIYVNLYIYRKDKINSQQSDKNIDEDIKRLKSLM